jgi:hypothetical protein
LSHPLVLLLVGALISGFLVPIFTNQWQLRQNELELKNSLISRINESISGLVWAVQYAEVTSGHPVLSTRAQENLDEYYRNSQIEREVIKSSLRAYFPNTQLPIEWVNLSSLVEDFYALTGVHDPSRREAHLQKIKQEYFAETTIDLHALIYKGGPSYFETWFELKDSVLNQKDELIQNIIQSRMPAFS